MVGKEPLDRPIAQALERDHGQPAARLQDLQGARERPRQFAQLVVHRHPQRLERARGRMVRAVAANRPLDQLRELARRFDARLRAQAHDRLRDAPCRRLLAVGTQDLRQFLNRP